MTRKQWSTTQWKRASSFVDSFLNFASKQEQTPRFYLLKDPVHNITYPFSQELMRLQPSEFLAEAGEEPLILLGFGTYPKPLHLTHFEQRSPYICLEVRNKKWNGDRLESETYMQVAVPFSEETEHSVEHLMNRTLGDVVQENLHNLMYCDLMRIRPERFSEAYMDFGDVECRMSPAQAVLLGHIRPHEDYHPTRAEAFLLDSAPFENENPEIFTRTGSDKDYRVKLKDNVKGALFGLWSNEIDQG